MTAVAHWGKIVCAAICWGGISLAVAGGLRAEAPWQERFAALSARAGDVMRLTPAELQGLLDECEALQPQVEALPESPRKLYRKRLALTCNLVRFALDQQSSAASPPGEAADKR